MLIESIILAAISLFDSVHTAYGLEHHIIREGNPIMLWVINKLGITATFGVKMLWLALSICIFEWAYKQNPKVIYYIRICIGIYIIVWLFGGILSSCGS